MALEKQPQEENLGIVHTLLHPTFKITIPFFILYFIQSHTLGLFILEIFQKQVFQSINIYILQYPGTPNPKHVSKWFKTQIITEYLQT